MKKLRLLSLLVAAASAIAQAAPVDSITFAVGQTTRPTSDLKPNTYRISVTKDWGVDWFDTSVGNLTGYWELAAGKFRPSNSTDYDVDIVPMFRYQFHTSSSWCNPFIEGGVGVAYLTEHKVAEDHDMSSHGQFSDRVGVGCSFDKGHQELGFNFHHFSNAGIDKPNPGIDFMFLRYGYHF